MDEETYAAITAIRNDVHTIPRNGVPTKVRVGDMTGVSFP